MPPALTLHHIEEALILTLQPLDLNLTVTPTVIMHLISSFNPLTFALLVVVFPGPNHRGARYHCQDNTCLFFSLRVSITSRTENLLPVDEFKVLPAIRPLWVHHLHYKLYGSVIPLYLRWVMGHSRIIARPLTSIICMFITLSDQRLPKKVTSSLRDVGSRPRMSAASQSSSVVMAI